MIDRRLVENFDWSLIWVLTAIIAIGLLSIYSALYNQIQANPTHNLFLKQLLWLTLGLGLMACSLFIDYQRLRTISLWIYLFSILLLLAVLIIGKDVNGAKRWLDLGGVQIQPSEFVKISIAIYLASYFAPQEMSTYPELKKLILPSATTSRARWERTASSTASPRFGNTAPPAS